MKKEGKQKHYFGRGVIFRKILFIFIFLSLIPVAFSSFLTISTYQGVIDNLEKENILVEKEITQLRQNILIQIFLILFLLVILVVFASVLVARSITRPVSALVQGVKAVSGGNLNVKFKIVSKDELGDLASNFNEMTEKLKEQRKREILVSRLKTEFISIAAHQLRTPLSSVKWTLKMLLDGDMGVLSAKQREFTGKGYVANERMIHLVNDLLDVSRIEEGKFGFEFSRSDFNEFMEGIASSFKQQAKRGNVNLKYKGANSPLFLVFDFQRLKMAVSNILDNAIRYTIPGGKVTISVATDGDFIKVSIEDTGAGIPENQQSRVFSKFFRGDNVVRMQTEGTGLGLYLSKNIVEKHGGKIWFESEKDKGTVFYFTLPYYMI